MSEWISVKDELPNDENDWVLITDGKYITTGSYSYHWVGMPIEIGKVTHWMPVPELPSK